MSTGEHSKDDGEILYEGQDLSVNYNQNTRPNSFFSGFLKSENLQKQLLIALVMIVVFIICLIVQKILYYITIKELNDVIDWQEARYNDPQEPIYSMYLVDDLKSLCSATVWQPNLYLNCTNVNKLGGWEKFSVNPQGATNVRNSMLSCVRWAIDGGMNLIMPQIAVRSEVDIGLFNHWENYDFLFDEPGLKAVMAAECPQLKIYDTCHHVENKVISENRAFTKYTFGTFRKHIDDLLASTGNYTKNTPTVVWENEPFLGWFFYKDSKKVHDTLTKAVRFRSNLVLIASMVISLLPSNFIGMHLRLEKDFGAYNYSTQVEPMLEYLQTNLSHIDTIYVAVGDPEVEEFFRADMKSRNKNVISKNSLLSSIKTTHFLMDEINSLTFDQKGAIDYHVLKEADFFFGIGISSFAFGLAFDRGDGNIANGRARLQGGIIGDFFQCF